MPTVWGVGEGARSGIQSAAGIHIRFGELATIFKGTAPVWLGKAPPSVTTKPPSRRPSHVIVEVRPEDGTNGIYDRVGYYCLTDIRPDQADFLIDRSRRARKW